MYYPKTIATSSENSGSASEALTTVYFGDIAPEKALDVVLESLGGAAKVGLFGPDVELLGGTSTGDINDQTEHEFVLFVGWATGSADDPSNKPGSFWCCAPYSRAYLASRLATSSNPQLTRQKRYDLYDVGIARLTSAPFEIDHLKLDEQAAIYDDFEAVTGRRFGLLVLSGDKRPETVARVVRDHGIDPSLIDGGKSLHALPVFRRALDPTVGGKDRQLWDEILKYQMACFAADTSVRNPGRHMRTPGVLARAPWRTNERVRPQTILRADGSAALDVEDYLDALKLYARHVGLATDEDVRRCVEANQLAERLERRARSPKYEEKLSTEERMELLAHAQHIRSLRVVTPEDAATAKVMLSLGKATPKVSGRPNLQIMSGGNSAPKTASSTKTTKAIEIPASTVIISQDGRTVSIEAWAAHLTEIGIRVQCPHCAAEGTTDRRGATLKPGWDGRPNIWCWREPEHRSRMVAGAAVDLTSIAFDEDDVLSPTIPTETQVHQRYLDIDPNVWCAAWLLALKSEIGTGKTTAIAKVSRGEKVLAITHRRSLARKLATDLGAVNYEDLGRDKRKWADLPDRLVVCVDSLHKVVGGLLSFDEERRPIHRQYTVIIDESEQVFRHLHGRTVKRRSDVRSSTWEILSTILLDDCSKLVVADAHLSEFSFQVIDLLMAPGGAKAKGPTITVTNTWTVSEAQETNRKIVNYPHAADLRSYVEKAMQAHPEYRPYIACDTRADAAEIHERLKKVGGAGRGLLVTSETITDRKVAEALANPNDPVTGFRAYRWVVASPSIGSGVSYDAKPGEGAFDEVLIFVQGGNHTWQDLVQQVGRPRRLAGGTIRAYVSNYDLGRPKAMWMLRRDIETVHKYATQMAGRWVGEIGARRAWFPRDARVVDSSLLAELQLNICGSGLRDGWNAYWEAQGCKVEDAPATDVLDPADRKAVVEETRDTKADLEAAENAAVAEAADLDVEKAREIERSEAKDRQEAREVRKAMIGDFYGIDPTEITADHVAGDDRGHQKSRTRNLGHLALLAAGRTSEVMAGDHRQLVELWGADRDYRGVSTVLRLMIIKAAGLGDIFREADQARKTCGSLPTSGEVLAGAGGATTSLNYRRGGCGARQVTLAPDFAETMRRYAVPIRRLLGIQVESYLVPKVNTATGKVRPAKPMGIVAAVLRQIGLSVTSKRVKSQARSYFVDVEDVVGALVLASKWMVAYLDKIEDRKVAHLDHEQAEAQKLQDILDRAWVEAGVEEDERRAAA